MDVVHGFAGIALVSCASWKDMAISHPKGTTANHVLLQFVEVSEETALAVAIAAFRDSFASVWSSFLQHPLGTMISNENKSEREPELSPCTRTAGSVNYHLYCFLLDFGTKNEAYGPCSFPRPEG